METWSVQNFSFLLSILSITIIIMIRTSFAITTTIDENDDARECDSLDLQSCNSTICTGPNCLCPSYSNPAGFPEDKVPQMVFLTFMDFMDDEKFGLYQKVFNGIRKNPNNKTITGTFFLHHDYNDYNVTHQLWRQGHEIGLHSITQGDWSYFEELSPKGWTQEFVDQRLQMATFANIPDDQITGIRVPSLKWGGDKMMNALLEKKLMYDSTMSTCQMVWPYTTDFPDPVLQGPDHNLSQSHPGFWIVPLVNLVFTNETGTHVRCATLDECVDEASKWNNEPDYADIVYDLLTQNFEFHYNGSRAPFNIFVRGSTFFTYENKTAGYLKFLDEILTNEDVYIISITKILDWIRSPQPLGEITIPSWSLPDGETEDGCLEKKNICPYEGDALPAGFPSGSQRTMTCCSTWCPLKYPWLGNPLGSGGARPKIEFF